MSWLAPRFEGELSIEGLADDFFERLAGRIRSGLFPAAPKERNAYELISHTASSLRFRSTNLLTGINVGLNDVRVEADHHRQALRYRGSYWVWTWYCVALSSVLTLVLAVFVLSPLLGFYLFPEDLYPPRWQLAVYGLPMVLFWGVVWPWVLVLMHRKNAARCLVNLLREVNAAEPADQGGQAGAPSPSGRESG